jgi:hypothetical protein
MFALSTEGARFSRLASIADDDMPFPGLFPLSHLARVKRRRFFTRNDYHFTSCRAIEFSLMTIGMSCSPIVWLIESFCLPPAPAVC